MPLHAFTLTFLLLFSPLWKTTADTFDTQRPAEKLREGSIIFQKNTEKLRKVVIDAGHGGHDSGCHSAAGNEKTNTLAMALLLGEKIKANCPDVQVIYTRTTDVFVELQERAAIANRAKADLFISIHCNSTDEGTSAQGIEVYTLGMHKKEANLNVAKRENSSIMLENNYEQRYDGFDPNSTEAYIVFNLIQNAYLARSQKFAALVETALTQEAKRKTYGVKQAGFMVLKETAMPSVLVETGFLNNLTEGRYISSELGQATIADALFEAFRQYKKFIEINNDDDKPNHDQNAPAPEIPDLKPAPAAKPIAKTNVKVERKPMAAEVPKVNTTTAKPKPTARVVTVAKKETIPQVIFKIQVASSNTPLKNTKQGKWQNIDFEIVNANGIYKYWVGEFADREEATSEMMTLRKLGFRDAFVVQCTLEQYP